MRTICLFILLGKRHLSVKNLDWDSNITLIYREVKSSLLYCTYRELGDPLHLKLSLFLIPSSVAVFGYFAPPSPSPAKWKEK